MHGSVDTHNLLRDDYVAALEQREMCFCVDREVRDNTKLTFTVNVELTDVSILSEKNAAWHEKLKLALHVVIVAGGRSVDITESALGAADEQKSKAEKPNTLFGFGARTDFIKPKDAEAKRRARGTGARQFNASICLSGPAVKERLRAKPDSRAFVFISTTWMDPNEKLKRVIWGTCGFGMTANTKRAEVGNKYPKRIGHCSLAEPLFVSVNAKAGAVPMLLGDDSEAGHSHSQPAPAGPELKEPASSTPDSTMDSYDAFADEEREGVKRERVQLCLLHVVCRSSRTRTSQSSQ